MATCPSCGNADYYFGVLGHSCINATCVHATKEARAAGVLHRTLTDSHDPIDLLAIRRKSEEMFAHVQAEMVKCITKQTDAHTQIMWAMLKSQTPTSGLKHIPVPVLPPVLPLGDR